ncbi:hypothetical protein V6N13_033839 [Hibiscus sabdariffa]|uniref:Uncharacterized protein n=1 Tax=Hibiscus sabdariffa TaxID=183260 RepID=A0ABR2F9E7_9ROSI
MEQKYFPEINKIKIHGKHQCEKCKKTFRSCYTLDEDKRVCSETKKTCEVAIVAAIAAAVIDLQLHKKIRAPTSYLDYTSTAYRTDIDIFKRAHQVATGNMHSAKVNSLLLFGDHILSVDVDGNVFIWLFNGINDNLAPIGHIKLDAKFTPTCIMHSNTYLNKVTFHALLQIG